MKDKKHLLNSIYYNNNKTIYAEKIDKNDNLKIRKTAPSYTQYYDKPQKNIKRCKIVVDSWYNGKTLSMMAHQHRATKETPIYYYIDVENGEVIKLKEYLNKHKKINSEYVYHGTKTQAQKRLEKIMA